MKHSIIAISAMVVALSAARALADFDISPFFQNGQLIVGGLAHTGERIAPPISVFGYDFGEDPYDPFNPSDPGVDQATGVGNLPPGGAVGYNILSSLLYWNGDGTVAFSTPGQAYINLTLGATTTLTGTSGPQAGSLIQVIGAGGVMHEHFTTSLYAAPGAGNVPDMGDPTYIAPADGIYTFGMELTLTNGGTVHASNPFWVVWNNNLSEAQGGAAMNALANLVTRPHPGDANNDGAVDVIDLGILAKNYDWTGAPAGAVPEPASMILLALGGLALLRRRK